MLGQHLLSGEKGDHRPLPVLKDAPLAKPPEHGVGGGLFPLQLPLAQLNQFPGGDRGIAPNQLGKARFHLA